MKKTEETKKLKPTKRVVPFLYTTMGRKIPLKKNIIKIEGIFVLSMNGKMITYPIEECNVTLGQAVDITFSFGVGGSDNPGDYINTHNFDERLTTKVKINS